MNDTARLTIRSVEDKDEVWLDPDVLRPYPGPGYKILDSNDGGSSYRGTGPMLPDNYFSSGIPENTEHNRKEGWKECNKS